eukprot:TRINITY_DN14828_c0_g1_i1.p1 TRINITY_DN14828_c0_g1~~TRINITY_DN14828_c0_g1_i1.p1  ORF type:complete len:685 (+),score=153.10 TRINITY_DN14828_c0_g1_i1:87-2141(+)
MGCGASNAAGDRAAQRERDAAGEQRTILVTPNRGSRRDTAQTRRSRDEYAVDGQRRSPGSGEAHAVPPVRCRPAPLQLQTVQQGPAAQHSIVVSSADADPASPEADEAAEPLAPSQFRALRQELAEVKASLRGIYGCLQPGVQGKAKGEKQGRLWRVVVTGGPCGGKSSGMARLRSMLEEQGLGVFVAPEAATILLGNGGDAVFRAPEERRADCLFAFQRAILQTQMGLEESFTRLARAAGKPALVLCDRGTLDGKAYSAPQTWRELLAESNLTEADLLQRYDAVVHMVTAADGAEDFYGDETNATRTETPEEARELDVRLRGCYLGHPALHIIDNSTGFMEKVERACAPILQLVGRARAVGPRQKFLLPGRVNVSAIPVQVVSAVCTFVYLLGSTAQNLRRIRIREFHGTRQYSFQQITTQGMHRKSARVSYAHDIAGPPAAGLSPAFVSQQRAEDDQRVMRERPLTEMEYDHLRMQQDISCPIVRREHLFFCYKSTYFDVATFLDPADKRGTTVVSVEAGRGADGQPQSVDIPGFLTGGLPFRAEAAKPALSDILGFQPSAFGAAPRHSRFSEAGTSEWGFSARGGTDYAGTEDSSPSPSRQPSSLPPRRHLSSFRRADLAPLPRSPAAGAHSWFRTPATGPTTPSVIIGAPATSSPPEVPAAIVVRQRSEACDSLAETASG